MRAWLSYVADFLENSLQALTKPVRCMCYGLRSGKRALADQMNRELQSQGVRVHRIGSARRPKVDANRDARRTRAAYQQSLARLGL